MPRYTSRKTKEMFVTNVVQDETTVKFIATPYSFVVPLNPLTAKIYEEDRFPYTLEFHTPTNILTGVTAPDGQLLYRIPDALAQSLAKLPANANRLTKDGVALDINEYLELLLNEVHPVLIDRLKALPADYLDLYYVYETKVSYLASNPTKPYLFDPTPQELMHATGIEFSFMDGNPVEIPGFYA